MCSLLLLVLDPVEVAVLVVVVVAELDLGMAVRVTAPLSAAVAALPTLQVSPTLLNLVGTAPSFSTRLLFRGFPINATDKWSVKHVSSKCSLHSFAYCEGEKFLRFTRRHHSLRKVASKGYACHDTPSFFFMALVALSQPKAVH